MIVACVGIRTEEKVGLEEKRNKGTYPRIKKAYQTGVLYW
jgi:hypothetical protein